jgi:ferredoxin
MLQPKQKVTIDYGKCLPEKCGCDKGVCPAIAECPVKLWRQEEPYDPPYPAAGFCQECGKCVEVCPLEAIRMLK